VSKLYEKLYEAARLDGQSINVLNENNLFSPAIYHCAQAVEKSSKSIHAYYMMNYEDKNDDEIGAELKNSYGHGLKKSTRGILDSVMRAYVTHQVKAYPQLEGTENEALDSLQNTCEIVVQDVLGMDEIVVGFNQLADKMYDIYKNFDSILDQTPTFGPIDESLKREARDPDKKYYWYIFLVMLLSAFLDKLEIYSRYPFSKFSNNNITILNVYQNKFSISRISEMITDLLNLVPLVWKQIDIFRTSLQK
jgi:hypothetical protein